MCTIFDPKQLHDQVFLNFHGEELRYNFMSYLPDAFEKSGISFFMDTKEPRGRDLKNLFVRIKESKIALAIFSSRYAESKWCMNELVEMKKQVDKDKLIVIPIFFKVKVGDVTNQTGEFGDNFRTLAKDSKGRKIKKWKEALESISNNMGLSLRNYRSEVDFVKEIVMEVQRVIEHNRVKEEGKQNCFSSSKLLDLKTSIKSFFSSGIRCFKK